MKTFLYFVSIVLNICLITSCSQYSTRVPRFSTSESSASISQEYGHVLTQEELINYVEITVPSYFSQNEKTKVSGKTVKEIIPLSETIWHRNLSSINQTSKDLLNSVYIINYSNEEGFAIVCSDNRTEQLIGYSDSGNIILDRDPTKSGIYDKTGQHTIDEILVLLPSYFADLGEYIIPYPTFTHDSLDLNGYYYCNPIAYYSCWIPEDTETAFTNATWGQEEPFNACFEAQIDPEHGPYRPSAGCAAIALGQIMNRYSMPEEIKRWRHNYTVHLDWPYYGQVTEEQDSTQALASLLRVLAQNMGSSFSYEGTGTLPTRIKGGLDSLGYTYDNPAYTNMDGFNLFNIVQSLSNGSPVVVYGISESPISAHFWDVEGFKMDKRYWLIDWSVYDPDMNFVGRWTSIETTWTETRSYLYCNWGEYGQYNGWFSSGIFNFNGISFTDSLKVVTGIRPL